MGEDYKMNFIRKAIIVGYIICIGVLIYANIWMNNYSETIVNDCSENWNISICPCFPIKSGFEDIHINLSSILEETTNNTP